MKFGRYAWPYFVLRCGLGIVFAWIGLDILRHPDIWLEYVPKEVPGGLSRSMTLRLNGALDMLVGLALLANLWPKIVAWVATIHIMGVLVMNGINSILIRDVGLLGTSLALALWPQHRRHKGAIRNRLTFWRGEEV